MVLNRDNTFMYKTCGVFMYGNWQVVKDSLFLKEKYSLFLSPYKRNDTPKLGSAFYRYKIDKKRLITTVNGIDDPKEIIINKLKKEL